MESSRFGTRNLATEHGLLESVPHHAEYFRSPPRHSIPAEFRCGLLLLAALLVVRPALCDNSSASDEDTFRWGPAIAESFLALSLANIDRVTTQQETRDAINGPFWNNYVDSIENLHGFNDGDGFFTSYVVHTMEGAFAGFVERQNDPKYRTVEFGTSQRYWISCMRSLAFSSAYSTVWSATPFGEPGVANVEKHNEPGLVDLIGTQTLGFGWMIGEDALDRYVIERIERHVRNPYVRGLARSTLNPMRSYANLLAFRVPWHRDTRAGVYAYRTALKDVPGQNETSSKFRARAWPEKTAFELQANLIVQRYLGSKGSNCIGGGGEGVIQLPRMELVFDIDGCELYGFPRHVTGDALTYALGWRWRYPVRRWTLFTELLVGGTKITHVTADPDKGQILSEQPQENHQPPPDYASYHTEVDTNGITAIANVGVSHRITDLLSWRVGTLSYQRSWMLSQLQGFDYNQGLRFTTGIAVTLGPWKQ